MVLVDTSVWIRFLAGRAPYANPLGDLLGRGEVSGHDFVYGELLMGDPAGRRALLTDFAAMHRAPMVSHAEVVAFVRERRLHGRGVGWIDAHLLASALVGRLGFWTADARLAAIARELGIAYRLRPAELVWSRGSGARSIRRPDYPGGHWRLSYASPCRNVRVCRRHRSARSAVTPRLRRRLFCALAAAALAAGSASARQVALPPAVRAAAEAISSERLAWDVAFLSADEQLGRNTPSPRFDAAADYITSRLARAGLAPAGDDGGFRQHYELHETRVDAEGASLTVGERRFALARDVALGSFATPLSGPLPVVYVQHGWVIPGRGIDPYAGVDVTGKLVVAHGPRVLPKGVEVPQMGRVAVGAETPFVAAAKRGAAGVLFITQAADLVRWDQLRTTNTVRREMSPEVPSAYAAAPVTSLLMAPHVTDAVFAGETLDGPTALGLADRGEFPASSS